MFGRFLWAIGIILLLVVVLVIGIITANSIGSTKKYASVTPVPSPHPTIIQRPSLLPTVVGRVTPVTTPAPGFQGTITGIGDHQVAYKNSTIIAVRQQNGTMVNVYVNTGTNITDENNQILDLPQLSSGMRVHVLGKPTEDGIDATSIKVFSAL